jgi:hypothetical protein
MFNLFFFGDCKKDNGKLSKQNVKGSHLDVSEKV